MINININLTATSASEAINMVKALRAEFGDNGVKVTTRTPSTGNRTQDMIDRSKARLAELGLTRAPKATAHEMSLRAQHDKTGECVNWSLDLVTRERIMRDGYDYDIYANNNKSAQNGTSDATGETFDGEIDPNFVPED